MYALFLSHTIFVLTKQTDGNKSLIRRDQHILLGFYCYQKTF